MVIFTIIQFRWSKNNLNHIIFLQAEVNLSDDENEDTKDEYTEVPSSKEPEKLYPTAPTLDESSDDHSTASAHSTSV